MRAELRPTVESEAHSSALAFEDLLLRAFLRKTRMETTSENARGLLIVVVGRSDSLS